MPISFLQTSARPVPGLSGRRPIWQLVSWGQLVHRRRLGLGAFGDVVLMEWAARGLMVAVKFNGTDVTDSAAVDAERHLYETLALNPHDLLVPLYGMCTDAPDARVRLVMQYCEHGCLTDHVVSNARPKVSACFGELQCTRLSPVLQFIAVLAFVIGAGRPDPAEPFVRVGTSGGGADAPALLGHPTPGPASNQPPHRCPGAVARSDCRRKCETFSAGRRLRACISGGDDCAHGGHRDWW